MASKRSRSSAISITLPRLISWATASGVFRAAKSSTICFCSLSGCLTISVSAQWSCRALGVAQTDSLLRLPDAGARRRLKAPCLRVRGGQIICVCASCWRVSFHPKRKGGFAVAGFSFRRRKNIWIVSVSIPLSPSCCAARAEGAKPRT
jgi:hypothetical protein